MGTGPQSGFESVLVRIWGMSSSGTAFFQNVPDEWMHIQRE